MIIVYHWSTTLASSSMYQTISRAVSTMSVLSQLSVTSRSTICDRAPNQVWMMVNNSSTCLVNQDRFIVCVCLCIYIYCIYIYDIYIYVKIWPFNLRSCDWCNKNVSSSCLVSCQVFSCPSKHLLCLVNQPLLRYPSPRPRVSLHKGLSLRAVGWPAINLGGLINILNQPAKLWNLDAKPPVFGVMTL